MNLLPQKVCSKTKSYTFTFCNVLALGSKKKGYQSIQKKIPKKKTTKQTKTHNIILDLRVLNIHFK